MLPKFRTDVHTEMHSSLLMAVFLNCCERRDVGDNRDSQAAYFWRKTMLLSLLLLVTAVIP